MVLEEISTVSLCSCLFITVSPVSRLLRACFPTHMEEVKPPWLSGLHMFCNWSHMQISPSLILQQNIGNNYPRDVERSHNTPKPPPSSWVSLLCPSERKCCHSFISLLVFSWELTLKLLNVPRCQLGTGQALSGWCNAPTTLSARISGGCYGHEKVLLFCAAVILRSCSKENYEKALNVFRNKEIFLKC